MKWGGLGIRSWRSKSRARDRWNMKLCQQDATGIKLHPSTMTMVTMVSKNSLNCLILGFQPCTVVSSRHAVTWCFLSKPQGQLPRLLPTSRAKTTSIPFEQLHVVVSNWLARLKQHKPGDMPLPAEDVVSWLDDSCHFPTRVPNSDNFGHIGRMLSVVMEIW